MKYKSSRYKVFSVVNIVFLSVSLAICIAPILNILAISFSSGNAAATGQVGLWPIEFTTAAYADLLKNTEFFVSLWVSVKRVVLALILSLLMCVLGAYPLSKTKTVFRHRGIYVGFFLFAMMFNGGLMPTYLVIRNLGLIDSIWALVLPLAVPFHIMILLMNFFRDIPGEIEEAAMIDGAGYGRCLWQIYLPLSKPALATIALFIIVMHWNEWMNGILYMNNPANYPLQSYLQTVIKEVNMSSLSSGELMGASLVTTRTSRAAQVFLAMLPVLAVYPFLQKYFTKGLVLGSVKG